jgi:phage FluMu protein Com
MDYVDFRCGKCSKLLGRIKGDAEIKCPRCSSLNALANQQTTTVCATGSKSIALNGGSTGRSA